MTSEMKKLTYSKKKKEYSGIAFKASQLWLNSEIIIVAPNFTKLKKFYKSMVGGFAETEMSCDPKLCAKVRVVCK